MAEESEAFEQHVTLFDGVLATSKPLESQQLDRVLVNVSEGLAGMPELQRMTNEIRTDFSENKVVGLAATVTGMLTLLDEHTAALNHFKSSIVRVLLGRQLERAPRFIGSDPSTSTSVPALETSSTTSTVVSLVNSSAELSAPSTPSRPAKQRLEVKARTPPSIRVTSNGNGTAANEVKVRVSPKATGLVPLSPASASQARRKRSLEVATPEIFSAASTPVAHENKKPKMTKNGRSAKRAMTYSEEKAAARGEEVEENDAMNPIYTIPTQWEELYFKPVEVIQINAPGAKEHIQALRFAGTPFILEGFKGWMKFSADWVRPSGELDTAAFLRGIHDVKVPVIERKYEESNPIKTHLSLAYYVKNYWEKGSPEYYMHQWQFPLCPKGFKALCYKCDELPVVGDNLLLYWLDAVRGDNPLQYLFMGQQSTNSRMHQDPGGLDITIAPIVGTKRVTMLHRSATKVDSVHEAVNFHEVDLNKSPFLAFLPAWQADIKPGQMLYMPEGTFHAVENLTACLSYHRFHVDTVNIPGFLHSFMAQDAPTISHAEILWNAAHDVMSALEENYHANGQALDGSITMLRKLDTLRALRHASRMLSLEETLPTEDSWDWRKLLDDIDHLLIRVDVRAAQLATQTSGHPAVTKIDADSDVELVIHTPQQKKNNEAANSIHWDSLNLSIGDTIGVQIFEKRNRATVLKIQYNMELVQIHYVDWGSIYDEFLPVSSLFQHGGRSRSSKKVPYKTAPKVHESVLARWGSNGQLYNAIVLKVIRSNACLVHYLKYEKDWDQWILPGHIFKNYGKESNEK